MAVKNQGIRRIARELDHHIAILEAQHLGGELESDGREVVLAHVG